MKNYYNKNTMGKLNNSNFELLQDVIKTLDLGYNPQKNDEIENLQGIWEEIVGKKISKFSKVLNFSADNIITIVCSDSYVSNELYYEKLKLLKIFREKLEKTGTIIRDIKFDYKKWKENENE